MKQRCVNVPFTPGLGFLVRVPTLSLSDAINRLRVLLVGRRSLVDGVLEAYAPASGDGDNRLPFSSSNWNACPASVDHTTPTVLSDFQTTRARRLPLSIYSANWSGTPVVLGNARRAPVADMLRMVQSMTLRRLLKTIWAPFSVRLRSAAGLSGWSAHKASKSLIPFSRVNGWTVLKCVHSDTNR